VNEHEKWVLNAELAHVLGWDASWRTKQFWIISSFRRPQVYRHANVMLRKVLLAILFVAAQESKKAQSVLILLLFLADALHVTFVLPYRSVYSNLFCIVTRWTLAINIVIGTLTAYETQSPVLENEPFIVALTAVHGVALVMLLIITTTSIACCARWPSSLTIATLSMSSAKRKAAARELQAFERWSKLIADAKECVKKVQLTPPNVLQVDDLKPIEEKVRRAVDEAHAHESPLYISLRRMVEDLESLRIEAQCNGLNIQSEAKEHLLSGTFRQRLETRAHDLALVPPNRRRVLLKLLALRTVLGDALYEVDLSVLDDIVKKRRQSVLETKVQPFVFSQTDLDASASEALSLFDDIDFDFDSTTSSTS
jgi:hypothetical protein